ncbi:Ervatamin-C,Digestive cysteine proteinase 1,Cathepsin L1,Zingipain-2 [Lepeophtheirus salmonis]|uniref:Ervatamin-C,Digestive cysteine proteinase 1,Cathepsin L1,Zingipain-2 n=1 Tax=Lepeophtheirus salmonis TaxID=72036 RepID=A0A7R8CYG1_LEPSM|nr:Ervatamin-C,Digestive cysteine proteinase 1,Cathepsin L1,Zingipain-2 [Lepeophtheirus salmonis]CAF2969289.1 Ervatamin-C,Digestive cysteine proteinase 1,Cathepsin L1,Zingipain-2 [Lepeophtheirus salmonis]
MNLAIWIKGAYGNWKFIKKQGDPPRPQWPNSYIINGILFIPYAEIQEPIAAFYDANEGKSRIDYYGGMDKTIQIKSKGPYGAAFKLSPYTNEKVQNAIGCFSVDGIKDAPIEPQSVLPDIDSFIFIGTDMINGVKCEKWGVKDIIEKKINQYFVWVKRSQNYSIPIRYEMRGYNSLLGSHYDHYYIQYENFSLEKPEPEVFEIYKQKKCGGFPGPGMRSVHIMNPIREFIHNEESHVIDSFLEFKKKHKRTYSNLSHEENRKNIFRQNMRFIHSTNRRGLTYKVSINHLTDRNDDEIKYLRGKLYTPGYNGGSAFTYTLSELNDVPDTLDWRIMGAVSPVKDQSVCGSCWSFGTVGTLEGTNFLVTGNMIRLSQQALVDCSWGFGNNGCDGGEDFRAYDWIIKHGGIPSERDYGPYLGADGFCNSEYVPATLKIKGFVNVTSGDLNALKVAIAREGPISVAIDASHRSLRLDHAVLAVGYGELNGQKYWLIKNSWSTYWGNDGYVLMSQKDNNCGVATMPTHAIPDTS